MESISLPLGVPKPKLDLLGGQPSHSNTAAVVGPDRGWLRGPKVKATLDVIDRYALPLVRQTTEACVRPGSESAGAEIA